MTTEYDALREFWQERLESMTGKDFEVCQREFPELATRMQAKLLPFVEEARRMLILIEEGKEELK